MEDPQGPPFFPTPSFYPSPPPSSFRRLKIHNEYPKGAAAARRARSTSSRRKSKSAGMTRRQGEALAELKRLRNHAAHVGRVHVPQLLGSGSCGAWKQKSKEIRISIFAEQILESDHYGLEKIKERILEFLAGAGWLKRPSRLNPVFRRRSRRGQDFARSCPSPRHHGRKYHPLSLGGVRRRGRDPPATAAPNRGAARQILQMMRKAGTRKPVFSWTKSTKMCMGFPGDPSAALPEVLDPEQNFMFMDHFVDVEYDLSQVSSSAPPTCSTPCPAALQDRMEWIRLSGYTEQESSRSASASWARSRPSRPGSPSERVRFTDEGLMALTSSTRAKARPELPSATSATSAASGPRGWSTPRPPRNAHAAVAVIRLEDVSDYLGRRNSATSKRTKSNEIGPPSLGLDRSRRPDLTSEATIMDGKGKLTLPASWATSCRNPPRPPQLHSLPGSQVRLCRATLNRNLDIHVHVPEGAIPRMASSAGTHHLHGDHQRTEQNTRALRRGHDRRDYTCGEGPCDRRIEGETAGRQPAPHLRGHHPQGQRERPSPISPKMYGTK